MCLGSHNALHATQPATAAGTERTYIKARTSEDEHKKFPIPSWDRAKVAEFALILLSVDDDFKMLSSFHRSKEKRSMDARTPVCRSMASKRLLASSCQLRTSSGGGVFSGDGGASRSKQTSTAQRFDQEPKLRVRRRHDQKRRASLKI